MKLTTAAYLPICALLCGCGTLGPDYTVPEDAAVRKPAATQKFLGAQAQEVSCAPLPQQWWRLYNDPRLDRLIGEALRANTDLRAAAANVKRAAASLELAKDQRLPNTALLATPSYTKLSAEEYLMPGEPLPAEYLYALEGSLSYQVDLFGQIKREIEVATADTAASKAAYDGVKIAIIAETTRSYLEVCSTGREIELLTAITELEQQLGTLQKRLLAAGRGTSTDVERLMTEEARTHAALPLLKAKRQAALYRLAALIGKTPAELPQEIRNCTAIPSIGRPLPIEDGQALLQRRPDVRQAEQEFRAATARIGVSTAELYPHVSIGVSGGSVGLIDKFLKNDTFKFSMGPLIAWEFPNRGQAKAHIRAAKAETEAAYARFDGVVLNALREMETSLTVYGRDLDRNADLKRAEKRLARIEQDTERLQRCGKVNVQARLEAQKGLLQASLEHTENEARLLDDQVRLFHALGGGW